MISSNKRQTQCKRGFHEFALQKDEETGAISPRQDAICPRCGIKYSDSKIEYEPPIGEYDDTKWRGIK